MYVFPGIGLGAILSKSTTITQSMIYASASALSTALTPSERASVIVARGVIRAAQEAGVDREVRLRGMAEVEVEKWVRERMYDPHGETEGVEREVEALVGEVRKGGGEGPRL